MTFEPTSATPATPVATSDKALMILCHLSAIFGAPFVLPFIVWLVKKNEPDMVAEHAKEALNFHLSWLIYWLCCIPLSVIFIGVPVAAALGIAWIVLAIVAAVKASDGIMYRYPLTIRMLS